MKRLAMPLLAAVLMANLAGCGGSSTGPTTGPMEQDLPDEVQKAKEASEEAAAKGVVAPPY